MPLHKNQIVTLRVESISSDGNGVGRHEGMAVFIPAAAVGDVLRVRITKPAKRHAFGIIEQIVTPGPGRQPADCPISRQCGGCSFRHLSYAAELEAKQGFVRDALLRIGGIETDIEPILPSPSENRYRNKVQYPVAAGQNGELAYGFYARRSHRLVPCDDCLLQPALLNRIAARCAQLLSECGAAPYDEKTGGGLVRHIYLRQSSHSGDVLLCIVAKKPQLPGAEKLLSLLPAEFPEIKTILININAQRTNVICGPQSVTLYGPGTIRDELCGVPMHIGPLTFAQVNTPAAGRLFAAAAEMARPGKSDLLLDLYCGTGVIGLSMAAQCKALIGVDTTADAIDSARQSATEMGIENAQFYCEDAGAAAKRLAAEGIKPDVITLDPPRKGLSPETMAAVLSMAPPRLVMVSCNPATLARDLAILTQNGYQILRVQPADLFPRTTHVECAVHLVRQ